LTPDVLIVGAGVIGAAAAFHLTRLGVDVTVLDREVVGAGMSSRSSALVRMHYTFPPEVDLAVRSDEMFDAWTELTGAPPCVRRTGFVRIVRPGEENQLRANVAMQRERGVQAEIIDRAGLGELAPGVAADDLDCVAWEPRGGYGDGAVVAGDLMAAARRQGAGYRPRTEVSGLAMDGDRVTGVVTSDGVQQAGLVLLAAGVWSQPLAQTAGLRLPIETEFHQVAVLAHPVGKGASIACIDSTTQTYFRSEADGSRSLVGAFAGPRGMEPDSLPPGAAPDDLAAMVGSASRRVPAFATAGIAGGVTGCYDMTPDFRPLLGSIPGLHGFMLAAGFSGMGFKISPAVGEALAELIVHGAASRVDVTRFRPGRFDEGEAIVSPFPYSDD